uniref:Acidic phospholipase A2 n=1 Tax=Bitis gabonica TaxID=8694 RepID=PA2A_BITGA|nr:RecName: Full=Acidic phospholipase A2; Short=svPLA2; AltName: Full=Phosphatidylcholine 2-acylhydrolase [Bitis gabonica]
DLTQFGNMINKMGQSVFDYIYYGCYCGWGGKGKPIDATDRCCFVHDCCYGKMGTYDTKWTSYNYEIQNGGIDCDEDPQKKELCECDRVAAICFANNRNTYNSNYFGHSSSKCTGTEQC